MIFGKTEVLLFAVSTLSLLSILTDLTQRKIYNWFTLSGMIFGILFFSYHSGWYGLGQALSGIFAALLFYGWMYVFGFMGAGDVKLLMAFGACGGPFFACDVGVAGIVLGGVIGLVMMILTGRVVGFIRRMKSFVLSLLVRELEFVPPKIDKTLKMPFGVAISLAALGIKFSGVSFLNFIFR